MKKRRTTIISAFLFLLLFAGGAGAQIAGNPVASSGTKEWTVGLSSTYFYQTIGRELTTANRFLLKSGWGVFPWLDLYVMGGASNLKMDRRDDYTISDYSDKYRFAYGGGVNALVGDKLQLWFGANAMRFKSRGNFTEPLLITGQTYIKRFEMNYDWREFKGYLGIAFNIGSFTFYGAGAGWYLWRIESKDEYRDGNGSVSYIGHDEGEYSSGLYTGAIVGIEMKLPQRYTITLEALLFNERNLQIMAGISQTGWQKMEPIEEWDE